MNGKEFYLKIFVNIAKKYVFILYSKINSKLLILILIKIISVNVITNADKSLLGVVKLATKEDARLAISCLHHKKIGYKRLNVNIAFSVNNNSPK